MSAPFPSSVSSPLLPVAQRLPFPVLTGIFLFYLEPDDLTDDDRAGADAPYAEAEYEHGGKHCRWNSNEGLLVLAGVCHAWKDAIQHVLFRSARVVGERAADRFLRTVGARPELGQLVRDLVVGLERGPNGEDAVVNNGQGAVSRKLLQVIAACKQLRRVQIRPLHHSVGPDVSVLLATLPLRTLVIGPRLTHSAVPWTGPMFTSSTLPISIPTVGELEIDMWVADVPLLEPLPEFPQLPLRHLCIQDSHVSTAVFAAVIGHSPQLEYLEVYAEHIFDIQPVQAALRACTGTLKSVTFIANPSAEELRGFAATGISPLMDRVLPHFTQLEDLYVSASEISIGLFALIPPSLKRLRIQAYNHLATFYYSGRLLEHLQDMTMPLHLETFDIHDAAASWENRQIAALSDACRARGIAFIFHADEAELE